MKKQTLMIVATVGFLITLSSDTSLLTYPATVTVPAGTDRITITVGTKAVAVETTATLSYSPAFAGVFNQFKLLP